MPPSPAMRRSPRRELKVDNYMRGHSLESGVLFREKDEDLALFDELQSSKADNFLLQSDDDFEDIFDRKLGTFFPIQGESIDILNAEEDRNDYDWLIAPPDAPLFTSLDDETASLDLAQRGRPRSLPISISGSSTIGKSRRSSKGSASPNRLSSSPRSGNGKRGRTSLTPQSSPTPSLRHATYSPPGKLSPSAPRSSTPTPQRLSTSCVSGSRGTSPVMTSRGNSASPKIRAWQSNIPGFSLEAPPNLRTSLADRPASVVRGSSPASNNRRDSSTRSSRHLMSPTASRSVTSSHSLLLDPFSSHTKNVVKSFDDYDAESSLSISASTSEHSPARRVGSLPNSRALTFSKKLPQAGAYNSEHSPARRVGSLPNSRALTFSKKLPQAGAYNSTSKRSVDSGLRQMDRRRSPKNMFRPLLSSVPSSTFYAGKTSVVYHAIASRNSVTSSSTASFDPATSATRYTEAIEQNQENTARVDTSYPDAHDGVFAFGKDDLLNEDIVHETQDGSLSSYHGEFDGGGIADCDIIQADIQNRSNHDIAASTVANSEAFDVKAAALEVNGHEDLALCSNCGQLYRSIESVQEYLTFCPDCSLDVPTINNNIATSAIVTEDSPRVSTMTLKHSKSLDVVDSAIPETKSSGVSAMAELMTSQHEDIVAESQILYDESIGNFLSTDFQSRTLVEEGDPIHANQQVDGQPIASYCLPSGNTGLHMQQSMENSTVKVDASGAGISVLLNRSSSCKATYLQSRTFMASSISSDDPSYVRDNGNSSRVSHGHGSFSASSSVDWASCRHTNTRLQRQSSGRKSDFEINKYEKGTSHRRTRSSLSRISSHGFKPSGLATSILECSDRSLSQAQSDMDVNLIATDEPLLSSQNIGEDDACKFIEQNDNCRTVDVFAEKSSSHILNMDLDLSPDTPFTNSDGSISPDKGKDLADNRENVGDVEASTIPVKSFFIVEESMPSSFVEKVEVAELPSQNLLEMETETEIENVIEGSSGAHSDAGSLDSKRSFDECQEPHVTTTTIKDTTLLAESDASDQINCTPESNGGSKAGSMTVEEVTDTILFCSSIIQKISYDAATIAVEKEIPGLFEGSRPTVTM